MCYIMKVVNFLIFGNCTKIFVEFSEFILIKKLTISFFNLALT